MRLDLTEMSIELQKSYKVYFNTLKTIDFIEVLDNVTMEWALSFYL